MSLHKLPRGLLEIPKGTKTSSNDNSTFMNNLERTNTLLAQFVSATGSGKKLMRQELEESYFNLTMYNLKESVKHKIEQDMWNNLFKKYISDLQNKIKNKDKSESSKAQSEISIFLDEAVGFYSKCIDTLSLVYNIRLPGCENQHKIQLKKNRNLEEATEEDIRYIVQHCYVHMGDLSRYHNLSKQAKFYYELAVQLNPYSGHAYNQLAILESASVVHSNISSNNYQQIIRTIIKYEYANTCKIPFPATRINLESLLRHVNDQSVSTLLTSNNSISDQNCMYSISIAWIHAYANLRMLHNLQRCRQLQQRIVDWAGELVKYTDACKTHWRELVSMTGLHCSLLSSYIKNTEYVENKSWSSNMHQFSQDFINAISRGLASFSHDKKVMDELLINPGCISIVILYLLWLSQYLETSNDDNSVIIAQCPLKIPFGEDFVKFLNILITQSNSESYEEIKKPFQLAELDFLMGFQPLKVPCKIYDIYFDQQSDPGENSDINTMDMRIAFIIAVCKQVATKWNSLLSYDVAEHRFAAVAPPEPQPMKKHVKIEPSVITRKPVNVALASMKINNIKSNGIIGQNIPSKVPLDDLTLEPSKGIITDVKIAKCIQEHIAQDTKSFMLTDSPLSITATINSREESHIIAPAPGLILSSNLPPEYKSMSSTSSASEQVSSKSSAIGGDQAPSNDQNDHNKLTQAAGKNHSYNPNREQFEKDLPPRFANKRSFTQESTITGSTTMEPIRSYFDQNNGGFTSMNYWDSINDFPTSQQAQFDNNLTKKESELLLPPTVPTSWLTEDGQDHSLKLESNITNSTIPYPFGSNLMHSQQSHSYSGIGNQSSQNHMNMMQQSFNQFKQNQPSLNEQDNPLQYLLQSVTTNANTPRFRSQTDALFSAQMNFDNQMYMQQANVRMPPKFHSIPPPTQQQSMNSHLSQQISNANQNYDSFQLTRPNFYDKPVFSTSNQSGFGYSSGSIMTQHQQPMQQQHHHQVRHNNPLLNLLPGFMNEAQR